MKYKRLGSEVVPNCTPAPMTMFDTRSCRERTGCTKECQPKKLKCDWCGKMTSHLTILEEVETSDHIRICYDCEYKLNDK